MLLALMACSTAATTGDGGGGGDDDGGGGGGDGGGGGGGGKAVNGWSAMPLLDDASHPDHVVHHKGNDRVSGIYFESKDKGFVVTQEASAGESRGGAVFLANASAVTSVAFSGDGTGLSLLGSIDFTGIQPTPNGYVAMAYASDIISSTDGGKTFGIAKNGPADATGIEQTLAFQGDGANATMVLDSGKVTLVAKPRPDSDTSIKDVWAPDADPAIPLVLQDGECAHGPLGSGRPPTRYSAYVSPDRQLIAYTSNKDDDFVPRICISRDGGKSFFEHLLDVDDAALHYVPSGVQFIDANVGIAWFAQPTAGAYIQRTTNGGETWAPVALPDDLDTSALQLPVGFFAPDGQHGWLAGFITNGFGRAVLLATDDAGASWHTVGGVADAVDAFHGGKLYAGFALDATHIWLGGEGGLVMHN